MLTIFASGENLADTAAFAESADNTAVFRDDALILKRLGRLFRNRSGAALSAQDSGELAQRVEEELI